MTDLKTGEIQRELTIAYWMEMETVMNYVCNSVNLDGGRAEEVKKAPATDVQEELGQAQTQHTRPARPHGVACGKLRITDRRRDRHGSQRKVKR